MTEVVTTMFPDGLASAPGLALVSEPGTGLFKKAAGQLGVGIEGAGEVAVFGANGVLQGVMMQEVAFVENTEAGTYTGTMSLPAGSRIIDIGADAQALWNGAGTVSLTVGDAAAADGFFTATNLKATDLLQYEINNIEHPGGKAGAYIASEQRKLYSAAARGVIAVITVGAGAVGTTGRTRVYVVYAVGVALAPVIT